MAKLKMAGKCCNKLKNPSNSNNNNFFFILRAIPKIKIAYEILASYR